MVSVANEIPEKLIYRDSVLLFCIHNNQNVLITKVDNNNCLLSVNEKIDTLDIVPNKWRNITAYNNKENVIYFTDNLSNVQPIENVYKLDLESMTTNKIKTFTNSYTAFIIDDYIIRSCGYDCGSLLFHNMDTNITDTLRLGDFNYSDVMAGSKILIEYYETGSIYGFAYYDWNNRKFIESLPILDTLKSEVLTDKKGFTYTKNSIYDIDYRYMDITGKYSNIGIYWIDCDFNLIQPTLQSYPYSHSSFTISMGNTYYYRRSIIERPNRNNSVWVACKFSLPFDKALYDIYHNTLLEKTTLENFDEWELHKLRNMIFAKHGYQFKSEYLQAFYNLFRFYSNLTKTNDINALLTPEDKKNLELIRKTENKK
jgi:hypothetical protein